MPLGCQILLRSEGIWDWEKSETRRFRSMSLVLWTSKNWSDRHHIDIRCAIIRIHLMIRLPYPLQCNARVLFFKMGIWVEFNSRNPSKSGLLWKKVRFYSRKTPKTWLFTYMGLYSRVALHWIGYGMCNILIFWWVKSSSFIDKSSSILDWDKSKIEDCLMFFRQVSGFRCRE